MNLHEHITKRNRQLMDAPHGYAARDNGGTLWMVGERGSVPLTITYESGYLRYKGDRAVLKEMLNHPRQRQEAMRFITWECAVNSEAESHVGSIEAAECQIEYDLDLEAFSLQDGDGWMQREPGDRPPRPIPRIK